MTWRERIELLKDLPDESAVAAEFARLAANWQTCAVGEWREQYPELIARHCDAPACQGSPRPHDDALAQLGSAFAIAVYDHNLFLADDLLDQIEDRVHILKREAIR